MAKGKEIITWVSIGAVALGGIASFVADQATDRAFRAAADEWHKLVREDLEKLKERDAGQSVTAARLEERMASIVERMESLEEEERRRHQPVVLPPPRR